jgi:regulator of sigma E protease
MLKVIAPLIVFGLVVFVHELGHFLAAKLVGVYAPRFSIGFGPALWRRRRGETEYILAAFPLGGYVRMASRDDETMAMLEGGSEKPVDGAPPGGEREKGADWDPAALYPFGPNPVPEHRWFESKPLYQRIFMLLAGVIMNALLALIVTIALVASYGRTIVASRVVGGVSPIASAPSLTERLRVGDTIVAINGAPMKTWNEINRTLATTRGAVTITTTRDSITIPEAGQKLPARGEVLSAIDPFVPAVVDSVIPDWPAAKGGMLANDSVVALDGTPVVSWFQMVDKISASPEKPVRFSLIRRGQPMDVDVIPRGVKEPDPLTGKTREIGRIGIQQRPIGVREPIGFTEAISTGTRMTFAMAEAVVSVLKGLVTGQVSLSQLGGPIAIARASVAAAKSGFERVMELLAFLSINVAVLNLLPIPILDGGQIVLNIVESAKGSAFSLRTREYIMRVGLLAIALLFGLVMFNDIKGLWQLFS